MPSVKRLTRAVVTPDATTNQHRHLLAAGIAPSYAPLNRDILPDRIFDPTLNRSEVRVRLHQAVLLAVTTDVAISTDIDSEGDSTGTFERARR